MVRALDKADAMLSLSSDLSYWEPFTIYHIRHLITEVCNEYKHQQSTESD